MPVQTKIQVRRDTAANWAATDPTLNAGEHGYETDTGKFKIGTGSTAWTALVYAAPKVTASRALASDVNGYVASTSVTDTELGYVAGVTSAIQTQLGNKQAVVAGVDDTEIGYLNGVTSGIQGQIDLKAPIESPIFTGTVTGTPSVPTAANSADNFGFMGIPQVSTPSSLNPLTLSHAGKHIYTTVTGQTHTIPASTTTNFEIGTTIVFVNPASVTTSIAIATDTLLLAGVGTTGTRTLAPWGMATAVKITSTSWIISGNGLT